jgi:hypothetical protein
LWRKGEEGRNGERNDDNPAKYNGRGKNMWESRRYGDSDTEAYVLNDHTTLNWIVFGWLVG